MHISHKFRASVKIGLLILNQNIAGNLIRHRSIKKNSVNFYLSTEFSKKYVSESLYISYPSEINLEDLPCSIVDIPLITNIIPVIWFSGMEYSIEEMDEDLYYSLIKIKKIFERFFYNTSWRGELKPKRLIKNSFPKTTLQSASLFTAGVDSTATVLRHFDENLNLISFNSPHINASNFAKQYNFNHYTICVNYYSFLKLTFLDKVSIDITKWYWDTTMGLAWIGTAAPFLYAKGIPLLYVPSGFTWNSFLFEDGQTLSQPACPLIDENLSPMGLQVQHDAFTMTRTDKIKFISTFCTQRNFAKPQLVVCNYHQRTETAYLPCHRCMKCYLTMLDILAVGEEIQDYGFTISEQEFIKQFKNYIEKLKMRRGGTYAALNDTQQYLKQNLENLHLSRRAFYDWFISVNLWSKIQESPNRPPRVVPFSWDDYQKLT